jgi:cytochrome c biogenesis protein CcmG/thiol:disulfide interchange protein DsbE
MQILTPFSTVLKIALIMDRIRVVVMKLFARAFLVGTFVTLLVCGCSDQEAQSGPASRAAPDFALKDLNGGICRLAELRGKVVVLNFFATWCGPCRQEIPDLVRLYERFRDNGLEIIGVSLDQEGEAVLRPFVKHYRISYPIVLGTRKVVLDYGGIKGIPTTFLIDHNGTISNYFVGLRPGYVIEESVRKLLKERGGDEKGRDEV